MLPLSLPRKKQHILLSQTFKHYLKKKDKKNYKPFVLLPKFLLPNQLVLFCLCNYCKNKDQEN